MNAGDDGPPPVRSTLARFIARAPRSTEEIEALRRRAWIEQGVVVLEPDELADDWLRQALTNEAAKRWGGRPRR